MLLAWPRGIASDGIQAAGTGMKKGKWRWSLGEKKIGLGCGKKKGRVVVFSRKGKWSAVPGRVTANELE